MGQALEISPPRPEEVDGLASLLGAALHFAPGGMREWMDTVGPQHFRAVRLDGTMVAGLGLVRMGHWFGGVSVPTAGVTAVGVGPAHRGSGIGSAMLRSVLEELHAGGVPLSSLYPATVPFYRRAGYERAGQRVTYELPLEAIDVRERTLDLVPCEAGAYDELYRAYEERARRAAGNLDRPAWMWRRRLEPKEHQALRYLVANDGRIEGYVVFTQGGRNDPLAILDICVLTPEAGRLLLALFAGYRSMVEAVTWNGGPLDPFVYLLDEPIAAGGRARTKVVRSLDWMLRIVDIERALSARGYPPGLSADLHLDVRDDLISANGGRWLLEVAGGRAEVRRGGEGRIRLGIGDLAALYTGFMAPAELRAIGTLQGAEADLALATSVFAGPRPWIADMF